MCCFFPSDCYQPLVSVGECYQQVPHTSSAWLVPAPLHCASLVSIHLVGATMTDFYRLRVRHASEQQQVGWGGEQNIGKKAKGDITAVVERVVPFFFFLACRPSRFLFVV